MIFLSIQHIPHFSCKYNHSEKKNLIWIYFFETLKRLLRNMPLMLTCSDYGPPILKKYPAHECLFVRANPPTNFFFSKMFQYLNKKNILNHFFFRNYSNLHDKCGIFWNEWKINFPIFIFWDMVIFVLKILHILCREKAIFFVNYIWY